MTGTPVVFIHGLWLHATSWQPWIELFERGRLRRRSPRAGPAIPTPSRRPGRTPTHRRPRHRRRRRALRAIIDGLPSPPILVGHSFGGMIAEKLLGLDYAPPPSHRRRPDQGRAAAAAVRAARHLPVFKNPANKHRAVSLTAEQFRYSFGNAVSEEESDALYERWTIPAPGKPLFEAAAANFSPHSPAKVDTATRTAARCC
jgi:pimeloyl-ACP methyl ester carboxylesterase